MHVCSMSRTSGACPATAVMPCHSAGGMVASTRVVSAAEHTDSVEAVAFSPAMQAAVTASMDGTMLVWDNSTMALRATCQHSEVPVVLQKCNREAQHVAHFLSISQPGLGSVCMMGVPLHYLDRLVGSGGAGVSPNGTDGLHRLPGRRTSGLGRTHRCGANADGGLRSASIAPRGIFNALLPCAYATCHELVIN